MFLLNTYNAIYCACATLLAMTCTCNGDEKNGFTIIEMLVVIAVVAILASITVVTYGVVRTNSELQTAKTDAQTIAVRLHRYKSENGSYPTSATFSSLNYMTVTTRSTITYTRNAANDTFSVGTENNGSLAYATSSNTAAAEGVCP